MRRSGPFLHSLLPMLLLLLPLSGPALAEAPETGTETEGSAFHGEEHATEHEEYGYFELGLFLGGATELNREEETAAEGEESPEEESTTNPAIGVELYYHGWKHFGTGILFEHAGVDLDRNNTLILMLGYHPSERIRLVLSPGVESTPEGDNFLLRFGGGYGFELGKHWGLVPELNLDYIEGGKFTLVYGVTLAHPL